MLSTYLWYCKSGYPRWWLIKYAFVYVKLYAWVLNMQLRNLNSKVVIFWNHTRGGYFTRLSAYPIISVNLPVHKYFYNICIYHCMFHILYDFYLILFFPVQLLSKFKERVWWIFRCIFISIVFCYSFELFALFDWV